MRGGANGSGAPLGSSNALKHGRYTAATIQLRREVAELIRDARDHERIMRDLNA
jgi:hypothetical protein